MLSHGDGHVAMYPYSCVEADLKAMKGVFKHFGLDVKIGMNEKECPCRGNTSTWDSAEDVAQQQDGLGPAYACRAGRVVAL